MRRLQGYFCNMQVNMCIMIMYAENAGLISQISENNIKVLVNLDMVGVLEQRRILRQTTQQISTTAIRVHKE